MLVTANTLFQQQKRQLYTWTSPDGQHWNQTDYILCSWRWRSSIESAKTRPGADCGSGHKLLIAKFRVKLKKLGTTTRPFRYDLNQILYDHTVEVTNRFKGLNLADRVLQALWESVHNIVQEAVTKAIPKKEMYEDKMVVWGGLTSSWEKKRSERQGKRGKTYPTECRVPENNKDR